MKWVLSFLFLSFVLSLFAQNEVKVSEENQSFSVGSKNCIVVTIPHGEKDFVEKSLQKELKNWNGKSSSSKDEFTMLQGTTKFMGAKAFDAYAKVLPGGDDYLRVAVAVDLGGAFLNSREHQEQYRAMSEQLKKFGKETAESCLDDHLHEENKILDRMQKDLHKLERQKEKDLEDIEDFKRKIIENEKEIEENIKNQEKTKENIKSQEEKIKIFEKKRKEVR